MDGLRERIEAALRAAGLDPRRLAVDDLATLDEMHALGRRGTLALAEAAGIAAGERVLDVGAGLGGPARVLAATRGAQVTACDRDAELCALARWLDAATGLAGRVEVVEADALALPFAAGAFDVVWTQHLQMSVADKTALATELRRVLAPGGRLAFLDVLAGPVPGLHWPVPWADGAAQSHLVAPDAWRATLEDVGFRVLAFDDRTEAATRFFARAASRDPHPLGLQLVIGDLAVRLAAMARNLAEGRVRVCQGVCAR